MKPLIVTAQPNKVRPVISTIKVTNGKAMATNLEVTAITKTNLPDGLYDKNLNLISKVQVGKDKWVSVQADEFPNITFETMPKVAEYDIAELLKILLISNKYIGSTDNLAINGIRFDENNIIATNTFAMSLFTTDKNIDISLTVPAHTIKILIEALKAEKKGKIQVYSNSNQVIFETGNYGVISRVIDLPFPDYKNIFHNIQTSIITRINRKELVGLLKKHMQVNETTEFRKHSSTIMATEIIRAL